MGHPSEGKAARGVSPHTPPKAKRREECPHIRGCPARGRRAKGMTSVASLRGRLRRLMPVEGATRAPIIARDSSMRTVPACMSTPSPFTSTPEEPAISRLAPKKAPVSGGFSELIFQAVPGAFSWTSSVGPSARPGPHSPHLLRRPNRSSRPWKKPFLKWSWWS